MVAGAGQGFAHFEAAPEEEMIGAAEFEAFLGGEPCAAEADGVQSGDAVVAAGDGERGQVFADAGTALHQGKGADADELMQHAGAGNEDAILHRHMPAEKRAVRNDDMISNDAIVADVAVRHEQIVRADAGGVAEFV